jgi:hypothetical protein
MLEPLIDDETFAELRDLEISGMFQQAAIDRDDTPIASRIPCTILPILSVQGMQVHAAVIGLGGGRASFIGYMPYGTDIADGDQVREGDRTFVVLGVGRLDTAIGLALSEVGRG